LLNSTDVLVIGGGPAGLAAAIAARQQGLRVVVADGNKPPIDTALGASLLWRSVVTGICGDEVQLGDRGFRASWIIGADGVNSRVRHWAGLDAHSRTKLRYAFRRHYRVTPWTDRMEIYWGKRSQAYATAISDEQVCVAVASSNPQLRLEESLCEFPELKARLNGAEAASIERGAITANRKLKRVWRKNIALIGDASGTADAITGEGLGLAFSQAAALANCLKAGTLAGYQNAHRRLALRPSLMGRLMLTLDGHPVIQQRTLQVFRRRPEIFRRLLALHVGVLSPIRLAADGLTLGWGLLTA
jgi:flavin-dependent dehydrogenase